MHEEDEDEAVERVESIEERCEWECVGVGRPSSTVALLGSVAPLKVSFGCSESRIGGVDAPEGACDRVDHPPALPDRRLSSSLAESWTALGGVSVTAVADDLSLDDEKMSLREEEDEAAEVVGEASSWRAGGVRGSEAWSDGEGGDAGQWSSAGIERERGSMARRASDRTCACREGVKVEGKEAPSQRATRSSRPTAG